MILLRFFFTLSRIVASKKHCNLTEADFPNHTIDFLTHKIRDKKCYDSHNRPHLRNDAYRTS